MKYAKLIGLFLVVVSCWLLLHNYTTSRNERQAEEIKHHVDGSGGELVDIEKSPDCNPLPWYKRGSEWPKYQFRYSKDKEVHFGYVLFDTKTLWVDDFGGCK